MKDEVNKDIRPNQGRLRSLQMRGDEGGGKLRRVDGETNKESNTDETTEKSNICFSICEMLDFSGG